MLSDNLVPQSVPRGFNDQRGCRYQGGVETEVKQTLERGPRAGVDGHLQFQISMADRQRVCEKCCVLATARLDLTIS